MRTSGESSPPPRVPWSNSPRWVRLRPGPAVVSAPLLAGLPAVAAAVAGGLTLAAAFPPVGWWPLAPVAVGLLGVAVSGHTGRAGVGLGMVAGLAFFLPVLHWAATYVGAVPWLLLAAFQALYVALLGGALAVVQRLRWWPLWAAALWVAEEALRGRMPFGGFPWARLAFSQAGSPYVAFAALGGAPLLTFVVALSGALLAAAVIRALLSRSGAPVGPRLSSPARSRTTRWAAAWTAAGALAVPLAGLALGPLTIGDGRHDPHRTVAVVQGNVPRLGLDFNAQREAVLRYHVRATEELARRVAAGALPRPEFVVWPENSSDIDPLDNPDAAALITRAARVVGVPILVGTLLDGPGNHVRNASIVWDPGIGPGQTYLKRHPVPFAEYIPLRSIARLVTKKVDLVGRDMIAGKRVGALQIAGTTVGDVICFEVADDYLVRDTVDHGATMLLVQTNNATFGRSGEAPQQFAMARIRAVEHGRTVMVASTTGISGVIAPDGTVLERSSIFTTASFSRAVPVSTRVTLADQVGAAPEWVLTAAGVGSILAGLLTARRRRTAVTSGSSAEGPGADVPVDDTATDLTSAGHRAGHGSGAAT